jgi:hypothetical protein
MQWEAFYNDQSSLKQYNADGSENKYADIDRSKLEAFAFFKDGALVFALYLEPEQRLIFRRRVEQKTGGEQTIVYMAGWQQTIEGRNVQSIAYIFPSGVVHVAGPWRDNHPWFYSIQPVPSEVDDGGHVQNQ